MAQKEAAAALANLLSKVARYSVILGIGGSALQSSLYTGEQSSMWVMFGQPQPGASMGVEAGSCHSAGGTSPACSSQWVGLAHRQRRRRRRRRPPLPPCRLLQWMAASGR